MESAEHQWNFFLTKIPSIPSPVKLAHTPQRQAREIHFLSFAQFFHFFHHKSVK